MVWKQAGSVFQGGTDSARNLYGKRVRARTGFAKFATFDPVKPNGIGPDINLKVGQEGFVGHPPDGKLDHLSLAFPRSPSPGRSLDQLMRSSAQFDVVHVNWPTFKAQFDVDV